MTHRADLYSLDAMLYEMVTGRSPFLGDDPVAIIGQHINTPPVAPTWHHGQCPRPLEALILRLLAKIPQNVSIPPPMFWLPWTRPSKRLRFHPPLAPGDDRSGAFLYDDILDGISGEYLVELLDGDSNVLANPTFWDGQSAVCSDTNSGAEGDAIARPESFAAVETGSNPRLRRSDSTAPGPAIMKRLL